MLAKEFQCFALVLSSVFSFVPLRSRHFRKGVNPCSSSTRYCGVQQHSFRCCDGGNAIVYQIWESYWKDATEFSNLGGKYRDCFVPEYVDRVVRCYMKRYATPRRLGREATMQDIARIHNGGPNGYKKQATLKYWKKVEKILNAG